MSQWGMRRGTGGSGSLFSFYGTACIDERIPLLQYSGALGNGGATRVDFTRGGLYLTVMIDPVSRQKLGTTRPKAPHVSPTRVAPKFISPLGVRAGRWGRDSAPALLFCLFEAAMGLVLPCSEARLAGVLSSPKMLQAFRSQPF